MHNYNLPKRQRAYMLTDTLLAVVIVTIVLMLAFAYFFTTTFNTKVSQVMGQIQILNTASYQWIEIKRQADFTGVSADALYQAGLISCKANPCTLKHPWGGNLLVANPILPANTGHVQIDLQNIPLNACQNLTQRLKNRVFYLSPCGSAATVPDFYIVM